MIETARFEISNDLRQRVERLATALGTSCQEIWHEALRQYVEREEQRERERNATMLAWQARCKRLLQTPAPSRRKDEITA